MEPNHALFCNDAARQRGGALMISTQRNALSLRLISRAIWRVALTIGCSNMHRY